MNPRLPLSALLLGAFAVAPLRARAGDELEIEVESTPVAPAPSPPVPPAAPPPAPAPDPEVAALRARLEAFEARLAASEAAPPAPTPAPPAPAPTPAVAFSGYLQPQVAWSQLSADEVTPEGEPQNQDRFVLRRARLTVSYTARNVAVWLEPDFNTVDGPRVSLNNAAFALFVPGKGDAPRLIEMTAGVFDTPFGFELPESSRARPFMERTLGSRALFPGDHDIGAQLATALGPVRAVVAVVNGVPLQNTSSDALVWTSEKTFLGRVGFDVDKPEAWAAAGGVSLLSGTGFSAGSTATKPDLGWSDENQNGTVTLDELVGTPGQAATPSSTFDQWAVGGDLELGLHTKLGWTRLRGEAVMASNLDRGYLVADPASTGYDLREIAWSAGALQEVTPYALVGFRADSYDPNSDAFETRRGDFIPTDVSVLTLSPLVAARWPGVGSLLLQYDYVIDHLGRDILGEPKDLANDQWTLRAQVGF